MFCLSVVDHIRLDFGHVAQNYTVHADAAERLAGYILKVRIAILALLAMTVIAAVAAIGLPSWNFDVSVAIGSTLALAAYVAQTALALEARVQAHRTCAHRLWLIAEGYRSLLDRAAGWPHRSVGAAAAPRSAHRARARRLRSGVSGRSEGVRTRPVERRRGIDRRGDRPLAARVAAARRITEGCLSDRLLNHGPGAAEDIVALQARERRQRFLHRRDARRSGLAHGAGDRLARELEHVVVAGPTPARSGWAASSRSSDSCRRPPIRARPAPVS